MPGALFLGLGRRAMRGSCSAGRPRTCWKTQVDPAATIIQTHVNPASTPATVNLVPSGKCLSCFRFGLDKGGKPVGVVLFVGLRTCHLRQVRSNTLRAHLHLRFSSQEKHSQNLETCCGPTRMQSNKVKHDKVKHSKCSAQRMSTLSNKFWVLSTSSAHGTFYKMHRAALQSKQEAEVCGTSPGFA